MNKLVTLPVLAASLLSLSSIASARVTESHFVTPQQLAAIHTGESAKDVRARLGHPEFHPRWGNGTYSMVYQTADSDGVYNANLYIDVDRHTHKVIGYSIDDNES